MGRAAMKAHFEMLAAHNAWANRRLYAAAADLADADYRRADPQGGSSMHKLLNHLFVMDILWMTRFRSDASPPWAPDHVAHFLPAPLSARRRALDLDIQGFVGALTPARLAANLTFRAIDGSGSITRPLTDALEHFFSHQIKQRGQCLAILTRLGAQAPGLDLTDYHQGP